VDVSASSTVPRRATIRAAVLAALTVLSVLLAASPAQAATWAVVPTVSQAPFTSVFLGTDLLSPRDGWAVGFADTGTLPTRGPIIQRYDGTRFTAVASPAVPGGGELRDVDGTSATDAWAVGSSQTSTGNAGLTERWNGSAWQIVPIEDPAPGFRNVLLGVKAFPDGSAWAVGSSSVPGSLNDDTVAQRWTGSRWERAKTPNPAVGTNELTAVDGISPDDVWAVGYSQLGPEGVEQPLIEHWDGNGWEIVAVPAERSASLHAVVAIAADDAWAVGTQFSIERVDFIPYALHWDGTAWTEVAVPAAETNTGSDHRLDGVAALGPKQVYAVGGQRVLRWNGSAWSVEPTGVTVTGFSLLDAAAAAPASVLAVGSRPRDAIGTAGTFAIRTNNG
jgi:hypothetical protein